LQTLFNLKFDDELCQRVYEIIVTHATAAEKMGPGGFDRCIEQLLKNFELIERGNQPLNCSNFVKGTLSRVRHASKQDLDALVASYTKSRETSMLREALQLAGFGGRIIIEKTHSVVPSVELIRGYTFEVSPAFPVKAAFERPRTICIDGFIESASEIHHLLEAASEAKEPCLMFVRGLSDDVVHTLKVNYDRGSLRVVPIIVKYDLEGINAINDIAVVCGTDLVSSLKGDLISSINFNEVARAELAVVYPSKVVINNLSTKNAVAAQVKALLTKRKEQTLVQDVEKLIDARIRSLSPNQVVIRLPEDKDFVTSSQSIDYALRAVKSAVDFGLNEKGELVSSLVGASVHADRCTETLVSLGTYVSVS
jgi:chaperonin GroEL (HSP60 family)